MCIRDSTYRARPAPPPARDGGDGQKAVRRAPGSTQGELLEGIGESRARQAGSRPGPGSGERAVGNSPHFGKAYPHEASFFDDSSAKWTSWGLGNRFCFPSRSKVDFKKGDYRREA